MFNRIFVLMLLTLSFVNAEPSIAQVKQAVSQNPSLLQTPQAQAMMKEKGVTETQVQQKLNENKTTSTETSTVENSENDIVTEDVVENSDEDIAVDRKDNTLAKRVNPFLYKTNDALRTELNLKQQAFQSKKLSRYSMSFYTNQNKIDSASLPTPDDYIISTGDSISVHVYGDREKDFILDVKNDGTVDLAFIGPVKIGGMKFKEAKEHLEHKLRAHFKMSSFNIEMNKYSTIQVTLVGETKFPGLYNLSSFSTVKELLIAAKGIRYSGSVRDIVIKRNAKIIAHLDFYDLLFKGDKFATTLLRHGDIVIIKKAKKLVSIDGFVNKASIFELSDRENLDKLIEYAGGMKPNASKINIKIDRYSSNSRFETFKVPYKNAKKFKLENGDKVYIYPLDFMAKSSINVYGNVIRPGSYRLNKKRTLNEFFKLLLGNGAKNFFLPQTYFEYGLIKRYSDDLKYQTQSFNVTDVINGKERVALSPNDQIYIFNQNDIYSNSYITTKGSSLVKPGKLQYFEGMTITDAINASGIDGLLDDKVRLTTYNTADFMPKTSFYSLKQEGDVKLSAYDELEVYDFYKKNILEPVSIKGEVVHATTVFYEQGMTLEALLNVAGGFNKKAYKNKVEIVRYYIDENSTRQKKIIDFDLRKTKAEEISLNPYDAVNVFRIPNWHEKETVTLSGEVLFPGEYVIDRGEKLSSVIRRAGGYTSNAFVKGAIFTRESIKQNQIRQYKETMAKVKRQLTIYNAMPANSKDNLPLVQVNNALDQITTEAEQYTPIGRVSIKLNENLDYFEDSEYNLVLKDKDTITIPSDIDTITVFGEVFNPTSFVYNSNFSLDEYINQASGYTRSADTNRVYVIHADGRSEPIKSGWFNTELILEKGDTIVVPIYIKENNTLDIWDSIAKILASFALTAAAVNSLGVI